jgi:putative DNA primase/helicase
MDFIQFARSHGIIIDAHPPMGVWKRFPTEDHPRSRNGAVKYMGDVGFVQNHATSTVVSIWKPDSPVTAEEKKISVAAIRQADDQRRKQQQVAIQRAIGMLNGSGFSTHPYLINKGFEAEQGNVLWVEGKPVLLIPMRVAGSLVGLQQIDADGGKKFLYGQRTSGATFTFDNRGVNIVCEGYATALSVRAAMKQMKQRYTLHVCFSAGNMVKVASGLERGIVIADNDASGTGQEAAQKIGWPTWMSDRTGEDANDFHMRVGMFAFTQSLTHTINVQRQSGAALQVTARRP